MTSLSVMATYAPQMTEQRERRIHAALARCNVRFAKHLGTGSIGEQEFPIFFSDIEWTANGDGSDTELVVELADDIPRAVRLVSELRACGMVVSIHGDG